jgi:hypothetical protein
MLDRRYSSYLGPFVYAVGGIALGVVGLVWGDFADVWQPIQALGDVPHRTALAYVYAVWFVVGGMAVFWPRTARAGIVVLSVLHLIAALFWVPRVIGFPRIFGTWSGCLEMFCMTAAGMAGYALLAPRSTPRTLRIGQIGRYLYGICVVSFALAHFLYVPQTAALVPEWIPPGQRFWAIATGVFHLMAALSILTGVLAVLGSRLLTAMLIGFGVLVWAPKLVASPHVHTVWAGNAINLSLAGAAWMVADWIGSRKQLTDSH